VEVVDKLVYTETGKISRSQMKSLYGEPRDKL